MNSRMQHLVRTTNALLVLAVFLSVLLGLVALSGCGGPEAVHSDAPTQTPAPPLAATDTSPLPTPPPTATPRPTETPPPTPTPKLYPTPEWSPYEDEPFTIVFQRCGELWLSEVGGQGERPLTNEGMGTSETPCLGVSSFDVSPSGRFIAYAVNDQCTSFVKVVNVLDGSTRLFSPVSESYGVIDYGLSGPQAWWDETHVAYYVGGKDTTSRLVELVIVDLETEQRTTEPVSAIQWPSPDGRYVLSGLQLHDRETGEQWEVIGEDRRAIFLGWSPAGRLMLFSVIYEEEESEVGKEIEWLLVVDAETQEQRLISSEDKVAHGLSAAWSPDGQTIAYMQCDPPRTGCGNPELWLTSPDGTNRHRIPMEESIHCTQLSWTPDGSRLVFETTREPSIWSVRLDGTDLRPIADGQNPRVLPVP